jgi:drug/metabolite transporter (DMT)-like permease
MDNAKARLLGLPAQTKGIIYGILSAMFVSAYILTNRYVYTHFDVEAFNYAVTFAAAGGIFAALGLLARHLKSHDVVVTRKTLPSLFVVGFAGGLAMALIVFGQNYTTAVNAGIIMTATIITTTFFSRYLLKESFNRRQWLWIGVMFIGLYLGIVGLHILKFNLGDLIILGASIAFGFNNTFSKLVIRKFDGNFVADARLIISGLLMLLVGFAVAGTDILVLSAGLWPLLAGLFFWLAIRTFYGAVQYVSANKAIVLNNSQIFFTALFGVLLLSEAYDWVKFIGSVIVLVGVYFVSKK